MVYPYPTSDGGKSTLHGRWWHMCGGLWHCDDGAEVILGVKQGNDDIKVIGGSWYGVGEAEVICGPWLGGDGAKVICVAKHGSDDMEEAICWNQAGAYGGGVKLSTKQQS